MDRRGSGEINPLTASGQAPQGGDRARSEAVPPSVLSLEKRRAAFLSRTEQYLRLGHDRLAAAAFVASAGGGWAGKALDVGTGKGLLAVALARLGMEVWSVDMDRGETELASYLAGREAFSGVIRFAVLDAGSLPFADGSFERVASMDCLHHLLRPEEALQEMARVLSDGGTLVLADFSPEGFDLVSRVHRAEGREHPVAGISVRRATAFLEKAGLRAVGAAQAHLHEVSWMAKPPGNRVVPPAHGGGAGVR
ncbi:MAG: class I SAM-dependent methyltransferase [Acidobacteriota bacterium]